MKRAPTDGSGTAIRFNVVKPPELPTITLKSPAELKDEFGTLEIPDVEILKRLVMSVPSRLEKPETLAA